VHLKGQQCELLGSLLFSRIRSNWDPDSESKTTLFSFRFREDIRKKGIRGVQGTADAAVKNI
jgi:hypothetical protein